MLSVNLTQESIVFLWKDINRMDRTVLSTRTIHLDDTSNVFVKCKNSTFYETLGNNYCFSTSTFIRASYFKTVIII